MRRIIGIGMLTLTLLAGIAGCGKSGGEQIANPWRDVTETEARQLCPGDLQVPEGAENVVWSVLESGDDAPLVQLSFDRDGNSFTAREQETKDPETDIAGMYYEWTVREEMILQNRGLSGAAFRYIGDEEWADLCTWYDREKGISYSVGVAAEDLDGFDLQAVAEALMAAE